MSDIDASRAAVRELAPELQRADATAQDNFDLYRLDNSRERLDFTVTNDGRLNQQSSATLPDVTLTSSDASNVYVTSRDSARPYRDFIPLRGSAANPTIGHETASAESEALLRHFDLIPGKANPDYVDARALQSYLQTNTEISADDRRNLTSAASRFDRIQQASDDEWGPERSGISRRDAHQYPRQEYALERQYTVLAYARENFAEMAGPDGKITLPSLRSYELRRAANGASRDELGLIGDIRRNNLVVGPNRYWVPLTTATLDSRFRPNSAVDTPPRNVANLAH